MSEILKINIKRETKKKKKKSPLGLSILKQISLPSAFLEWESHVLFHISQKTFIESLPSEYEQEFQGFLKEFKDTALVVKESTI